MIAFLASCIFPRCFAAARKASQGPGQSCTRVCATLRARLRYVLILKMAHYDDGPEWMKWDNLFIHQPVTYRLPRGGHVGESRFNGSREFLASQQISSDSNDGSA